MITVPVLPELVIASIEPTFPDPTELAMSKLTICDVMALTDTISKVSPEPVRTVNVVGWPVAVVPRSTRHLVPLMYVTVALVPELGTLVTEAPPPLIRPLRLTLPHILVSTSSLSP